LSIEPFVKQLADEDAPLKYSQLLDLSGLSPEGAAELEEAWPSVPVGRRLELMAKLAELSEDNLQLDFTSVFVACLGDADSDVREAATLGLWECQDRMIIRPLVRLLGGDPSANVRTAAAISLGRLAAMVQDAKLPTKDEDKIRSALLSAIERDGENMEVRRRAIESVACLAVPEIERIIRDAYESGDLKLKQSAIYAMGRTSDPRWLPAVLAELGHESAAVRYEAVGAAGLLGEESTVPQIVRLIGDKDPEVALAGVRALGAVGGPTAQSALRRCLNLDDEVLEDAAQEALDGLMLDDDPLGIKLGA
jgi:HEAT repeat protein